MPERWLLLYKDGTDWKPVERPDVYGVAQDRFNEVTFARIKTTAVRIEAHLHPGWSAGICEWQVE